MKRMLALAALFACAPAAAFAQTITVQQPNVQVNVTAADDFATRAFQDPWDMNERTDFGWWLFSDDAPGSSIANPTFLNGIFSGTVTATGTIAQPSLFLLETGDPVSAPVGKIGTNFPINADATNGYTHLIIRMSVTTGTNENPILAQGRLIWAANSIYDPGGETVAGELFLTKGWFIYDVNIPALRFANGPTPWAGLIRSLRWMPTQLPNEQLQVDFVRLVQYNAALFKTISWQGSNNADVYLDNDTNPGNGTLGRIASGVTTGSVSFFVGGLPGGDYWAVVVPKDTAVSGASARSQGFFRVNEIPRLQFTSPSEEGSSDDFATAKLGNPWDFDSLADIDLKVDILSGDTITSAFTMENEAGTVVTPNQRVYFATNTPGSGTSGGFGDPQLYMIFWDFKGKTFRIDPNRYRVATLEYGIGNVNRSLVNGSVGRILWRNVGETNLNTSRAFRLNSKAGSNVMAKVIFDMKAIGVDPSSASQTGWNGLIDAFRFDPHEFSNSIAFYVKRIKLAAFERTVGNSYTIRWNYSEASGSVSLTAINVATGAQIAIASNISAVTGSRIWDTTFVPDGTYNIRADFSDGINSNSTLAKWPLVVDSLSGNLPTISFNRSVLNYGIIGGTRTSSQNVRISFSGPGSTGSPCWIASSNNPNVTVSPATGGGPALLTVSANGNFGLGTTNVLISISSCSSSANTVVLPIAVRNVTFSTPPAGSMDTPANGQTVSGSTAVTGWAVDDIQISRLAICRDPVAGEAPGFNPACGNQPKMHIGDAALIDDARPDIESLAPTSPFNYRAGWGYLMLTNFLPFGGNGTFGLYAIAIDKEGQATVVGAKLVNAQNPPPRPFGAIDTPAQGETICGTQYVNFGWALSYNATIPPDSSTIQVFIDGFSVGRPGPLGFRPDIAALFPGYANTNNAVGGYVFDTTTYANGVHTIFWLVTDNFGRSDGIGSRFFTIANPCGS